MIWSVVSKSEMDGFGTSPVFRFYREVIGKESINLAVVDEEDNLDFVQKDDIVLLRTATDKLLTTIREKGIRSTAESPWSYDMVRDKVRLAKFLNIRGIRVPEQYSLDEVEEGKTYFVKPRFGSDSFGISDASICHSTEEVKKQVQFIETELHQDAVIEDFIEGIDCTASCVQQNNPLGLLISAITVECEETGGVQTRDCKVGFKEYCSALVSDEINRIAGLVFHYLCLKHHARIDFRKGVDGKYYLIDINLLPGLGPIDHFAKCLLLCENMSYKDAIMSIIKSAS